jgi:Flp pilus assembly protein CpaB
MPAGSVRPGDRVDVLATFGGQRPYTETVATGLEVLSVLATDDAAFAASGAEVGPTLVLLVTPDAAERLAYAKAFADLAITIAGVDPG